MSKADLDKVVAATAKTVESWRSNIKAIEAKISDANARLAKADHHRQRFALDARLGKPQAIEEVAKARAESASAEADLRNLQQALSDVKLRLVEAEREAENARRNLRRFEVRILQREMIENAAAFDEAGRNLERLYLRREELGRQIINISDAMQQGMHAYESAVGGQRLRASLPSFLWKLPAAYEMHGMKPESLAVTEARFWNLPVETTTTKAA
jgi:chromosome segregation ATPase